LITLSFIVLLGLIFLGPRRMAEVAKKGGGYIAHYRQMQVEIRSHLHDELLSIQPPGQRGNDDFSKERPT
jgi:Sec-independent protein translocase protein TatA